MISDNVQLSGVWIVADESAEWRCAGVRQIDRLLLALNAYSANDSPGRTPLPVHLEADDRSLEPGLRIDRLPRVQLVSKPHEFGQMTAGRGGAVAVMSTRLVMNGTADIVNWLGNAAGMIDANHFSGAIASERLAELVAQSIRADATSSGAGYYLGQEGDLAVCEDRLLRDTGKPQDGVIARYLNRPISRAVTRLLVKFPVSPNQITIALMILPAFGIWSLARGTYWGFVVGAFFFHLHSALDGCDGEIARLKFLQSKTGAKLDEICDRLSSLMYAVGLGIGLQHQFVPSGRLYLVEGIAAALVIGIGESVLTRKPLESAPQMEAVHYEWRHSASFNQGDQLKIWIMRHSKMLAVGERFANFFSQMTKRDVFNFGFFVLALIGRATWILHIFGVCASIILALALGSALRVKAPLRNGST